MELAIGTSGKFQIEPMSYHDPSVLCTFQITHAVIGKESCLAKGGYISL